MDGILPATPGSPPPCACPHDLSIQLSPAQLSPAHLDAPEQSPELLLDWNPGLPRGSRWGPLSSKGSGSGA